MRRHGEQETGNTTTALAPGDRLMETSVYWHVQGLEGPTCNNFSGSQVYDGDSNVLLLALDLTGLPAL